MDKKKIRSEITALRKMMTQGDLEYLSERIKNSFCGLDVYKAAKTIYFYMSNEGEVSTDSIITQAIKDGKKVAAPRLVNEDHIEFVYFNSFSDFVPDFRNILEPKGDDIADDNSVLILIPGLAFDYDLNRIGAGSGYYDKYLSSHKNLNLSKIALAFDFQIYKHLDVIEPHDEKLDMIVTPTMIIGS